MEKTVYDICTSCLRNLALQGQLGSGSEGTVYSVCLNGECNWVLKVYDLTFSSSPTDVFSKYKEKAEFAGEMGFGAEFYDGWICHCMVDGKKKIYGMLVTEKLDVTLKEYVLQNPHEWQTIAEMVVDLAEAMMDAGVVHGDFHWENIMVHLSNEGNELVAIDFDNMMSLEEYLDSPYISEEKKRLASGDSCFVDLERFVNVAADEGHPEVAKYF